MRSMVEGRQPQTQAERKRPSTAFQAVPPPPLGEECGTATYPFTLPASMPRM